MGEFEDRIKRAIERGEDRASEHEQKQNAQAMTEDEYKTLHGRYRLRMSDHIEECVRKLPSYFPGFRFETIFGERGWGGACSRDDFGPSSGSQRSNVYSRLEMTVLPYSALHVLELTGKGTVKNKEIFRRTHFKELDDVEIESFMELVNTWVVEYAERFASNK